MEQNTPEILHVIISKNPPIDVWCHNQKGFSYSVIDKGEYYILASDVNKETDRRCIMKDHCTIID